MPKRIRVEGLQATTTPTTVQTAFLPFGSLVRLNVDLDEDGASTGVAHLEYATTQAGASAIATMNNTKFDGAIIKVRAEET